MLLILTHPKTNFFSLFTVLVSFIKISIGRFQIQRVFDWKIIDSVPCIGFLIVPKRSKRILMMTNLHIQTQISLLYQSGSFNQGFKEQDFNCKRVFLMEKDAFCFMRLKTLLIGKNTKLLSFLSFFRTSESYFSVTSDLKT